MASKKKLLQAAAGQAGGGATTDITDVFSTFLYDGTSATQNIANGINLGDNIAGSVDFDGAGDSLESTSHSFAYGTGDFTVEFWMYPHSLSSQSVVFGARANSSTGFMIGPNNSGEIRFYYNNAERIVDTGNALSTNTWFHIAVTRASGTTKLFKNGTQVGSSYSDTNNYTSSVLEIGQRAISDGLAYDGLVSNVRVVLGTAVYTSNFTAPTEPLTAISGTELLICTANNFLDEGPNNIAFTVKGDPQVSSSSPFTGNTGEGGLVWIKRRNGVENNDLYDTVRGATKDLRTNATSAQGTESNGLQEFNSNGFTVGGDGLVGVNGGEYVSWTFRKAPKFFDVVTYTGNSTENRKISHNLGCEVGMILVKRTSSSRDWVVYHRGNTAAPETDVLYLNLTDATTDLGSVWYDTAPTSTEFTLGDQIGVNANGETYVAYLFAHNNSDGGFGPDADQDVIKCGSYTGNGSTSGPEINLGFEPQFLMIKKYSGGTGAWEVVDIMRGFPVDTAGDRVIRWNSSGSENTSLPVGKPTATGFQITTDEAHVNQSGHGYIYMAIRRGPLAEPTSASDVFTVVKGMAANTSSVPGFTANHVVDFAISSQTSSSSNVTGTRLLGDTFLSTDATDAETANSVTRTNGYQNGFFFTNGGADSTRLAWMWKRAPSYFDVCCYTGNATTRTISHNLGAVPEMMWVKQRDEARSWYVYHKDTGATKVLVLNETDAADTYNYYWNDTAPTSSVFTVASNFRVNKSGGTYIAYLFATLAGVSKVGSVSHNSNSATDVDCGFQNGCRFLLIKQYTSTGAWFVYDSQRGIVSGADPRLKLNDTSAENTSNDDIDPLSSGFTLTTNFSGGDYIFYAIAA